MDDRRTGLVDHRRGYLGLLFYPFYAIAARVLIRAKVRFLDVHIWALEDVGQLAMDFDTYLKEQHPVASEGLSGFTMLGPHARQ